MIDSTGEPSFWERSARVMPAKQTPLSRPKLSPSTCPTERPLARNRAMPTITSAMAIQSARIVRSPSSQDPNKPIHTGAVYWSRMALAAVVSLVATQNAIVQDA